MSGVGFIQSPSHAGERRQLSVLLNFEGDPCSNLPQGPFTLLQGLRGLTCISGFPGCLHASPHPKTSPKLCFVQNIKTSQFCYCSCLGIEQRAPTSVFWERRKPFFDFSSCLLCPSPGLSSGGSEMLLKAAFQGKKAAL